MDRPVAAAAVIQFLNLNVDNQSSIRSRCTALTATSLASERVKPPRVKESPVHMECELLDTLRVGDGGVGSSTIVVGKILLMHVAESAYRDGKLLIEELKPLSRLAGLSYGRTSGIFDLPRPDA